MPPTSQFEIVLLIILGQFIFLSSLIATLFMFQFRDRKSKFRLKDIGLKAKAPYDQTLILPHRNNQSMGNQVNSPLNPTPEPSVGDILKQPPNSNMFLN